MNTLTDEQIESNKQTFLSLLQSVQIEGALIEDLVKYLEGSDFFEAPASTKYHNSFKGGLCAHCLNVYDSLMFLYQQAKAYRPELDYPQDSLIVVALLHDLSKANFYEPTIVNKKVYSDQGTKKDNLGKFDWFSEESYKVRELSERVIGGDHGFNSMMLVNRFIPLTYEESIAILNHHCGFDNGFVNKEMSAILNRYPLVSLLHMADWFSTYTIEGQDE